MTQDARLIVGVALVTAGGLPLIKKSAVVSLPGSDVPVVACPQSRKVRVATFVVGLTEIVPPLPVVPENALPPDELLHWAMPPDSGAVEVFVFNTPMQAAPSTHG